MRFKPTAPVRPARCEPDQFRAGRVGCPLSGIAAAASPRLLNVVAGLLPASSGGVVLDGREVNDPGPDRAVVFQNHSLLPWLTCRENIRLAVDQVFGKTKKPGPAQRLGWTRT